MFQYRLPLLSGVLFALIFYPFYIWPLAVVVLVPLLRFAAYETRKKVFWGGCLTGALGVAPTLYFSLFSLLMQQGTPLLTYAVRASSLLFLVAIAALFGLFALGYRELRDNHTYIAALAAGLCYTLLELLLFFIFTGYNYVSLAYALAPLHLVLSLAALGSVPLVAFVLAFWSSLIAERAYLSAMLMALMLPLLLVPFAREKGERYFSVAVVQVKGSIPFGAQVEPLIAQAALGSDLVVYPFSPVAGEVGEADNTKLGEHLQQFATSSVLLWQTRSTHNVLYDEYALWNNNHEQTYRKRVLYPFSDYLPTFFQWLGVERLRYTLSPGPATQVLQVGDVAVGGLICSELHNVSLAQRSAQHAQLVVAVGWDLMFPNDLSGNFGIAAAQFRAAESGVPVVRGALFGPSALIGADGSIQALLPFGQSGILRGALNLAD